MFKRRKPDEPSQDGRPAGPERPPVEPALTAGASTRDSGLGVPPFRPAAAPPASLSTRPPSTNPPVTKEPSMARSPFAAPLPPPQPQAPPQTQMQPAPRPVPVAPRAPGREPAERRTLVVGKGISLQGVVQDAERLVVEGTIEATMIHATELAIAQGGVFKGEIEVEDAEIAGTIDGTLTVRGNLTLRATGRVLGTARCRRLQVEDGGQITGRMEMITETRALEPAAVAD